MTAPSKSAKHSRTAGRLLAIGGAEDPDEKDLKILTHFVKLCGGKRARILIVGAPSEKPDEKERTYSRLFKKIGAADVMTAGIHDRNDAEDKETARLVDRATGVFLTGGDQLRLTSLVAGTITGERIKERLWSEGLVVGGTSAGAAAMSSTMVAGGKDDGTARRGDVDLAPGLGYWRDTTVDTHFAQRGRLSRMLTIFAQNPQILGVGIDENTAVEVQPGQRFTVIGEGAVYVFDGRVSHSNAPAAGIDGVLAMSDASVHVLPEGYGFDLKQKRPVLPNGRRIKKDY